MASPDAYIFTPIVSFQRKRRKAEDTATIRAAEVIKEAAKAGEIKAEEITSAAETDLKIYVFED